MSHHASKFPHPANTTEQMSDNIRRKKFFFLPIRRHLRRRHSQSGHVTDIASRNTDASISSQYSPHHRIGKHNPEERRCRQQRPITSSSPPQSSRKEADRSPLRHGVLIPVEPLNLAASLEEVLRCYAVDRLMASAALLSALEQRIGIALKSDDALVREPAKVVRGCMQKPEMAKRLEVIRLRGSQCKELTNAAETTEGWTLVSQHGGTATYFQPLGVTGRGKTEEASLQRKQEVEDGMVGEEVADPEHSIRIRVEGEVACSPMEQLAAMREADQYKLWMPLCLESELLHREGNADQVLWWSMGIPRMFTWDVLLHAWGADCMLEDGSVVIVGGSIRASDRVPPERLPLPPAGWGSWRVSLHQFRIRFKVVSPNTSHITASFILDPKLRAKTLVNYVIKRGAALSLSFLRSHAEKVLSLGAAHPLFPVLLADPFYRSFLAPRVLWYVRQHLSTTAEAARKGEDDGVPAILRLLHIDLAKAEACDPYPPARTTASTDPPPGPSRAWEPKDDKEGAKEKDKGDECLGRVPSISKGLEALKGAGGGEELGGEEHGVGECGPVTAKVLGVLGALVAVYVYIECQAWLYGC